MAATHPEITPEFAAWIGEQPLFFVASAPLAADGHVNVSPRGLDTFRVLGPHQVAYIDLTGSGNETAAHLQENGRITVMFCAFSGKPRILRLYGHGRVIVPADEGWPDYRPRFPAQLPGVRQIVVVDVERIQTSCGFGVPLMDYRSERETLAEWATRKGPEGLEAYRRNKNARSLDGLPAPDFGPDSQT
ncbi:MAG TPA: pyridoxamine 5'-phosphate oxidase family protein [Gammaproteobacteria bacterium]|nr:pyridoxamine 5'-phosphate oxidase family protein [Gammaproteobacteria bacterium]